MPQQFQKLKNSRRFKKSSARWLSRQINDQYVVKAKQDGWRCRAAFKLIEIDEKFKIFRKGKIVVDLGSAPGGWSQYAVQKVGEGNVLAIDLLAMPKIAGVDFLQLDFLEENSVPKIISQIMLMKAARQSLVNQTDEKQQNNDNLFGKERYEINDNKAQKIVFSNCDIVLSDMAANSTGDRNLDHLRIINLLEESLELAEKILVLGGCFVGKIFQGGSSDVILKKLRQNFTYADYFKPKSSRQDSRESYIVARNFRKNTQKV